MKQQKQDTNPSFLDSIASALVSWFPNVILGTCFLGGGSYFIYDAIADLNMLSETTEQFGQLTEDSLIEIENGSNLVSIYTSGWFLQGTNVGTELETIHIVLNSNPNESLPENFKTESIEWIASQLIILHQERGNVGIVNASNDTISRIKDEIMARYALTIDLLQELRLLIQNWDSESVETKNLRRDSITAYMLADIESLSFLQGAMPQIVDEFIDSGSDVYMEYSQAERKFFAVKAKFVAAIIGIVAGSMLIGIVIIFKFLKSRNRTSYNWNV